MTVRADIEVRDGVLNVTGVTALFDVLSNWAGTTGTTYDVAPDGRFLLLKLADPSAETGIWEKVFPDRIQVVQNWFDELRAKMGTPE